MRVGGTGLLFSFFFGGSMIKTHSLVSIVWVAKQKVLEGFGVKALGR